MKVIEILVLLVPSILIFLTVYVLMKRFFDAQLKAKLLDHKKEERGSTTTMKLQAYERLLLLCERISYSNLLLRIRYSELSSEAFASGLVLAIQQEYEHNVTQQLYVSEQLWEIIKLAKSQMIEIVSQIREGLPADASGKDLAEALIEYHNREKKTPIETAKLAIKREAGLIL